METSRAQSFGKFKCKILMTSAYFREFICTFLFKEATVARFVYFGCDIF